MKTLFEIKTLILALTILVVSGCTDAPKAKRILEEQGFTNIKITGYRWGCGEDDNCATGFKATSPKGNQVTGVVCSGFGPFSKGATVRFD